MAISVIEGLAVLVRSPELDVLAQQFGVFGQAARRAVEIELNADYPNAGALGRRGEIRIPSADR